MLFIFSSDLDGIFVSQNGVAEDVGKQTATQDVGQNHQLSQLLAAATTTSPSQFTSVLPSTISLSTHSSHANVPATSVPTLSLNRQGQIAVSTVNLNNLLTATRAGLANRMVVGSQPNQTYRGISPASNVTVSLGSLSSTGPLHLISNPINSVTLPTNSMILNVSLGQQIHLTQQQTGQQSGGITQIGNVQLNSTHVGAAGQVINAQIGAGQVINAQVGIGQVIGDQQLGVAGQMINARPNNVHSLNRLQLNNAQMIGGLVNATSQQQTNNVQLNNLLLNNAQMNLLNSTVQLNNLQPKMVQLNHAQQPQLVAGSVRSVTPRSSGAVINVGNIANLVSVSSAPSSLLGMVKMEGNSIQQYNVSMLSQLNLVLV